jgi:serine/threonine protein kinase
LEEKRHSVAKEAIAAAGRTGEMPFKRPNWMDPGGMMKFHAYQGGPGMILHTFLVQFKGQVGSGGNSEVWRISEPVILSSSACSGIMQQADPCNPFSPSPRDCALKVMGLDLYPGNAAHALLQKQAYEEFEAARAGRRSDYVVETYNVGHICGANGYLFPCLLMALAPHGSLLDRICPGGVPKGLPRAEAARYVAMVLLALERLHGEGVIHRDIKPHNVLLFGDAKLPQARLTDFGSAAWVSLSKGAYDKHVGTPGYEAPEMEAGLGQDGTTDIFLLAEMFLHLRWGKMPFWYLLPAEGDTPEVLKCKKERRRDMAKELQHPECPYTAGEEQGTHGIKKLSGKEMAFVTKCLEPQANARPKVMELLEDPLMKAAITALKSRNWGTQAGQLLCSYGKSGRFN